MPRCYILEDTDDAITIFIRPLVAGVIVHLLLNMQRLLGMLLASPAFALRFPNLCILRGFVATSWQ